jgi:hypothetical protein
LHLIAKVSANFQLRAGHSFTPSIELGIPQRSSTKRMVIAAQYILHVSKIYPSFIKKAPPGRDGTFYIEKFAQERQTSACIPFNVFQKHHESQVRRGLQRIILLLARQLQRGDCPSWRIANDLGLAAPE